jgi:hypothetical protein
MNLYAGKGIMNNKKQTQSGKTVINTKTPLNSTRNRAISTSNQKSIVKATKNKARQNKAKTLK